MSMLRYSNTSQYSKSIFFEYRNDVDIFVEDRDLDKEFYVALFQNVFHQSMLINDVTPLGCKKDVIDAWKNYKKIKSKRRKYFLCDGDLDLITGTNINSSKNLIILDSYCIENYLIDETGTIELIHLSKANLSKDKIINALSFDKWIDNNCSVLISLFLHLALLKRLGIGADIKSTGKFTTQVANENILDKIAVQNYIDELRQNILDFYKNDSSVNAIIEYEVEIKKLKQKWKDTPENMLHIVSGKNYLIPMLQYKINHTIMKGKSMFRNDQLKLFLAKYSKLDRLQYLKKLIT